MLTAVGFFIFVTGLAIALVGAAGGAFYPVRRRLPVQSPIALFGFGGLVTILGMAIYVLGKWLRA